MSLVDWSTRRLYKFEAEFFRGHVLNKSVPMIDLRRLARQIWLDLDQPIKTLPKIRAGRGTLYNGSLYSYYQEDGGIVLARNQRTIPILIHELVHALGFDDHNRNFVDAYFILLRKWANLDWWDLLQARIKYKI